MYGKIRKDFYGEPPSGMQILLERCESAFNYDNSKNRVKSGVTREHYDRPMTSYGLRQNRPHEIRNRFLQTPNLVSKTPQPAKAKSVSELRRRHFLNHIERELESRIYSNTPSNYAQTPSPRRSQILLSKASSKCDKYFQESEDEKELDEEDNDCTEINKEEISRPQSSVHSKHSSDSNKEQNSNIEITKSHFVSDSVESISKCSTKSSLKGTKIDENEEEDGEDKKKTSQTHTEIDFQSFNPFALKFLSEMNDPSDLYHVTREEITKKPIIAATQIRHNYAQQHPRHDSKFRRSSVSIDLSLLEFNRRESSATDRKRSRTSRFINWSKRSKLLAIIRFRKAVRMIQLMLQACTRIKASRHTNVNDQSDSFASRALKEDLVFDLNMFRRPKDISLTEEAKKILRTPIEERTEEMVKMAVVSLVQTAPEYGDFPEKIQKAIAQHCYLEEFGAGRVVIRQGHKADNFYFIVSGITSVSISDQNPITGEPYQRIVAYLKKGKTFGELAIMHRSTRNATVTCHTDLSVLSIERDDFIGIFMNVESGKEPEHISYLRTVELFNNWPIDMLPKDNPRVCLMNYFRKGLVMCKDSNNNDWLYVVKNGSCRVIKALKPPAKNQIFPEQLPFRRSQTDMPSRSLNKDDSKTSFYDKHINSKQIIIEKKKPVENETKKSHKLYIEVQQLFPRDIFGLVHLVFGSIEESTSVTLVSDGAECILINKAFFMKYMSDELRKKLRENVRPYPSEFALQNKLQTNKDWEVFKNQTLKDYYDNKKKMQDSLFI